jgi:poly(glycerol-phosphate) alpha-glucosyltransferase
MRIAELTRSTSRLNGGIFFAQVGMFPQMARQDGADIDLRVFGGMDAITEQDRSYWTPIEVKNFHLWPPRNFVYSPQWLPALRAFRPEVLHIHGLWTYPSWISLRLHRQYGIPLIVSPHGMLDAWALSLSPLKKRLIARLFERAHLEAAAAIHALNHAEARAIRAYGLNNPIVIIPNGVDLPAKTQAPRREAKHGRDRTLLFLGRLHPKKGLEPLLEAWSQFTREGQPGQRWRLVIAGWDEAKIEARLRAQAAAMPAKDSVEFPGPLIGKKKTAAYTTADAFILPSLSEGLPMTVLEAWSHGKPALLSPACNLPEGVAAGAAYEIVPTPEGIAQGLNQLASLSDDALQAMGAAGRCLVEQRFTWTKASADMLRVYRAVAVRAPLPNELLFSTR